MDTEHLKYWLALWLTPGVGVMTFQKLYQHYPTLKPIFHLSVTELEALQLSANVITAFKTPDWRMVDLHLQWAEEKNNHIITWASTDYPTLLKNIYDPPPVIFLKGARETLQTSLFAMVGSRRCSYHTMNIAKQFSKELSNHGFTIISGLAIGVDGASHQGCLDAKGKTIAVLGTGLSTIYPKQHHALADKIIENGALLSEFPLNTSIHAKHFPRRNRLISGLAIGTLVVEAGLRSGSLITARYAMEQGRDVFAVPHTISQPNSKGCHLLIKQGAKLVENVNDILEEIDHCWKSRYGSHPEGNNPASISKEEQKIIDLLDCSHPTPMDALVELTRQSVQNISHLLLELELKGFILAITGGYVKIL